MKWTQKLFGLKRMNATGKKRENGRKYEKVFSVVLRIFFFFIIIIRVNMKIFMVFCALYGTRTWIEKLNSYHYEFRHTCQHWPERILHKIRFYSLDSLWLFLLSFTLPRDLSRHLCCCCCSTFQPLYISRNKCQTNQMKHETRICYHVHVLIAGIFSTTLDTYWSDKTFRSIDSFEISFSIFATLSHTSSG